MRRTLMVSLVAALAFAGCGGGDDDKGDGGGKPLTKAEFIRQADAICTAGDAKIAAATKDLGADTDKDAIAKVIGDSVLPNIQEQHDKIADLAAPKGDEDEIDAMLSTLQAALDKGKADPASIAGESDPFAEANAKAKAYGLTVCGQG